MMRELIICCAAIVFGVGLFLKPILFICLWFGAGLLVDPIGPWLRVQLRDRPTKRIVGARSWELEMEIRRLAELAARTEATR